MDIANVLINILLIAGIIGLFWYAITRIPLPEIARTILLIVVLCVIGIILLASMLTGSYHGIVLR